MFQTMLLFCDIMHAPGMHCIELCNVLDNTVTKPLECRGSGGYRCQV